MELLLNLYLGHLLGDFVLQPGRLVAAKRRHVEGLVAHVGVIGLSTAAVLWADLHSVWNIVLLAMAAHLLIEVVTIRARDTELSGLSVFLIDQGLHIASLVTLVWLAEPLIDVEHVRTFGVQLGTPWVALACALVGVTYAGSILLFEVVNLIGPTSRRRTILPFDSERLIGMVERGSAVLLATFVPALLGIDSPLAPPLILVAAFVPRIVYALRQPAEDRAYQMLLAVGGLIVAGSSLALVAAATLLMST